MKTLWHIFFPWLLLELQSKNLIHGNIKPDNLLLFPPNEFLSFLFRLLFIRHALLLISLKISDVGHLELIHPTFQALLSSKYPPLYDSPEKIRNCRPLTPSTDMWSAGVVIHMLCTHQHPFAGRNPFETVAHIVADPPSTIPRASNRSDKRISFFFLHFSLYFYLSISLIFFSYF